MTSRVVFQGNPYVIGVPIDDPRSLFGRQALIDFVRDNLAQGAKAILLSGQRRMGKSSVLRQIPMQIRLPEFEFVPFDLQSSTGVSMPELLGRIADAVVRALQLPDEIVPSAEDLNANLALFVDRFLPAAMQSLAGRKLVLLLDEFDALGDESDKAASQSFFQYLNGILDRESNLRIIAVIGRRLDQMPSLLTLFKGAPHQEIGLLSETAASKQIASPAAGIMSYSPAAVAGIFALSSGHPYFTQLICHVLFQRARDEYRWQVDAPDVEAVVDDAITAGEGGLTWFRDGLEIPERTVFSAVAELGDPKVRARVGGFLKAGNRSRRIASVALVLLESYGASMTAPLLAAEARLLEWGFLRDEDAGSTPSPTVTVELVRRWLVRRYPVRWEIFELERLVPEAQALFEQGQTAHADGDFVRAIALWERALDLNPNHMHALMELAEALLADDRFDRAAGLFERAYRADPQRHKEGYLQALMGYARDLIRDNRYLPARDALQIALKVSPDNRRVIQRLEEAEKGMRREVATRNPFYVGSGIPAEQFVGRSDAISEIVSACAHGGNVALFGQTGTGKTSLLQYLGAPGILDRYGLTAAQVATVNIDCQLLAPMSPPRFWQQVQNEVARALGINPGSLSGVKRFFGRTSDLSGIQRLATESGRTILLLLDEFEKTLEPNDNYDSKDVLNFQQDLRALAGGIRQISMVISTHRRLVDTAPDSISSPLFNAFKVFPLRMFEEYELTELGGRMPLELPPISELEFNWARTVAGGYPCLAESAFALLFRLRTASQAFDAVSALQALSSEAESFLTALWQGLNAAERTALTFSALLNLPRRVPNLPPAEVLASINQGSIAPLFGSYSVATRLTAISLLDTGMLRLRPDGTPETAGSLLEWWVLRRFLNTSAGELTDMLLTTQLRHLTPGLAALSRNPDYRALPQMIGLWARPVA